MGGKVAVEVEGPDEGPVRNWLAVQNTGDIGQIKRIFDEAVVTTVLDMGYTELHMVTNVKIVLGLVTCLLALVAQFYPVKFPGNYTVLVVCVAGYCAFNTGLQLYITYVEKGMVLLTKPKEGGSRTTDSGLAIRCKMQRFSENVTISVMRGDAPSPAHPAAAEVTVSVCDFMYKDGVLAENKLRGVVEALVGEFEAGRGRDSRKTK